MTRTANRPGKWNTNPMNFSLEVTGGWSAPSAIGVLDSTVRKVTGMPGAKYDPQSVAELADYGDRIGARWIEVNLTHGLLPSTPRLLAAVNEMAKRKRRYLLVGTAFPTKKTIDEAIENGVDAVSISPWGGYSLEQALEGVEYVKERGVKVTTALRMAADAKAFEAMIDAANRFTPSVEYIGLHENTGASSPDTWRYMMKELHRQLVRNVPIVPHIHDTYGHSVGAAINAVLGGCRGIDLAMNGVGVHCGLANMEEVVACLEIHHGVDTGIDLRLLTEYSRFVERVFRFGVHPNKALTGREAFIEEMSHFVEDVLHARDKGEPRLHGFSPRIVGSEFRIVWGEATLHGEATAMKLRQMGVAHGEAEVKKVHDEVERTLEGKRARDEYPYYLNELEFELTARKALGLGAATRATDQNNVGGSR